MTIRDIAIAFGFEVNGQSAKKVESKVSELKKFATKALSAIGIGFSLVKVNQLIEDFTLINQKIKTATQGLKDQEKAEEAIEKAAENSRSTYEDTATVVTGLLNSQNRLFDSVEKTTQFAELMNKAFRGAGLSATETASLASSLTSAFSTGKVSASQFQQLMTKTPQVITYLSQTLGISERQVKALGTAGKITANQLYTAFNNSASAIDKQYGETALTISDALKMIRSQFGQWLYQLNDSFQITQSIAKLMLNVFTRVMSVLRKITTAAEDLAESLGGVEVLLQIIGAVGATLLVAMKAKEIGKFLTLIKSLLGAVSAKLLIVVAIIAAAVLVVEDLINFFQGNESVIGGFFESMGETAETLKSKLSSIFDSLKSIFGTTFKIVGEAIGTVAQLLSGSLAGGINTVVSILNKLLPMVQAIIEKIAPVLEKILGALSNLFNGTMDSVLEILSTVLDLVLSVLDSLWVALEPIVDTLSMILELIVPIINLITPIIQILLKLVQTVLTPISEVLKLIFNVVGSIISVLVTLLNTILQPLIELISGVLEAIQPILDVLLELVNNILNPVMSIIKALFEPLNTIIDSLRELFNGILQPICQVLTMLANILTGVLGTAIKTVIKIFEPFLNILSKVFDFISKIVEFISGGISNVTSSISDWASGVAGTVGDTVSGAVSKVGGWVSNAISGAGNWVSEKASAVGNAVSSGAKKAWGWVKGLFGAAEGGYVEPNNPMPIIVGDNTQEGEIISPISKMKQTMLDALATFSQIGSSLPQTAGVLTGATTNRSVVQNVEIRNNFECDSKNMQQQASNAMSKTTKDTSDRLAHALAYAR